MHFLGFFLDTMSPRKPLTAFLPECQLVTAHSATHRHGAFAPCGNDRTPLRPPRAVEKSGWRCVGRTFRTPLEPLDSILVIF